MNSLTSPSPCPMCDGAPDCTARCVCPGCNPHYGSNPERAVVAFTTLTPVMNGLNAAAIRWMWIALRGDDVTFGLEVNLPDGSMTITTLDDTYMVRAFDEDDDVTVTFTGTDPVACVTSVEDGYRQGVGV